MGSAASTGALPPARHRFNVSRTDPSSLSDDDAISANNARLKAEFQFELPGELSEVRKVLVLVASQPGSRELQLERL